MNLPNKITMCRLALAAMVLILLMFPYGAVGLNVPIYKIGANVTLSLNYIIAGVLFIIASFTDFLDGNIARLIRFKNVTDRKTRQTEVLCFDFQEEFLRNFLDERVMIYPVSMEDVEKTLKLKE